MQNVLNDLTCTISHLFLKMPLSQQLKYLYSCSLFDNYFSMVQEINFNKNYKIKPCSKGCNARNKILLLQASFFALCLHTFFMAIFTGRLPNLVNLALCNWFFIEGIPPAYYILIAANILLTMKLTELMFFCNSGATFSTLYDIVVNSKEDGRFFVHPNQKLFAKDINIVHFINHRVLPLCRLYLMMMHISTSKFK